jgi:hypothetical protein
MRGLEQITAHDRQSFAKTDLRRVYTPVVPVGPDLSPLHPPRGDASELFAKDLGTTAPPRGLN